MMRKGTERMISRYVLFAGNEKLGISERSTGGLCSV